MFDLREGEVALSRDLGDGPGDGHIVFIGYLRSPWLTRETCPKNMAAARQAARQAHAVIDPLFRQGLAGLTAPSDVILLTWLNRSPRNLIVQRPRHAVEAKGVFALRSPVRPNPIGLHVVRLLEIDHARGQLRLEAIDVLDGTPLLDVKPYFASTDAVREATERRDD